MRIGYNNYAKREQYPRILSSLLKPTLSNILSHFANTLMNVTCFTSKVLDHVVFSLPPELGTTVCLGLILGSVRHSLKSV